MTREAHLERLGEILPFLSLPPWSRRALVLRKCYEVLGWSYLLFRFLEETEADSALLV